MTMARRVGDELAVDAYIWTGVVDLEEMKLTAAGPKGLGARQNLRGLDSWL